ncbi:MAG: protein kinase [Polyangiaceae bacterium]|nr:protein kinase [Polyangiaceae bacterium]
MVATATTRACPQCGTGCQDSHQYCPTCGFPVGNVSHTSEDRMIGRTLPGGYHILDLISVGGMGRVYRAEQSVLGRTVAVKVIHPHLLSDENSALRFMTEARAASQLNHPNSVSVYDFGRTEDGQPYLVMEFLRGKDLATVAWEEGPLPFARIVDVMRQALAALGEAHELGIVHRDLKPENIILEPLRRGGDFVKVVDFGLAKLKGDAQGRSITNPGIVCGTPDYMSPEQGRGDNLDGRSDLYGLGVVLFQLLTGRLPFDADSPTQIVMMHLTIPVPDPRQVAPERNIPEALVEVVQKSMAKDAAQRYQDASEFSDGLTAALRTFEVVAAGPASAVQAPAPLPAGVGTITALSIECPACKTTVVATKFCGECGERLPARSRPEALTVTSLPLPLMGREEDLAWLEDRRKQVVTGVVGARIVAEAGGGKTRLLREFANRAQADGDRVVLVGPDPHWCEAANSTLREAIRGLTGLDETTIRALAEDASPEARRGIEDVFDGERGRRDDKRSAAERRFAAAEALRWALLGAAKSAERRVILAIDELHRIDGPSRAAFADALGEPPEARVLMLCTHASGFESGWGASHAARVLGGLPPPALSRVLSSVPEAQLLAAEDETGRGVLPMYAEQLLRFHLDGGNDPPQRLGDLIGLRVDTLDPAARRTLQALSVLGDRVKLAMLSGLLPKNHPVESSLGQLETAGMAERSGELWSTSHPLLRELVLTGIPAAVRREFHAKALRVCEQTAAPIEAQALHAYEAQDSFQALLLLEQVADRATGRGDLNTEIEALRRGLEIARRDVARGELDDPLRAVLIFARKLGSALTRAGNFADAEGILREALDIAGPSGADRARVLGSLAQVSHGRHRQSEALDFIEQAIETARQSGAYDLVSSFSDTRKAWAS